ncbi:MAG: inorganic phosphate transporter [Candidatus Goldbacteria bacterium]|nr:inorganic phosphate transporter [Candidatus Goldiibacteriota bacterium]
MALVYVDAQHTVLLWIVISCHAAIALGTMFGGWHIVKTKGAESYKVKTS